MNGKKAKAIRRGMNAHFTDHPDDPKKGEKMIEFMVEKRDREGKVQRFPRIQLVNPRRMLYQGMKKMFRHSSIAEIKGRIGADLRRVSGAL